MYDVFISYRRPAVAVGNDQVDDSDLRRAEALHAALEDAGLTVFRDTEIETFTSIPARLQQALAQSKMLLAVYSPRYPESRWCQWELTTAYLAGMEIDKGSKRVQVVNTAPDPGHIVPTELADDKFPVLEDPDDTAKVDAIARQCKKTCGDIGQAPRRVWAACSAEVVRRPSDAVRALRRAGRRVVGDSQCVRGWRRSADRRRQSHYDSASTGAWRHREVTLGDRVRLPVRARLPGRRDLAERGRRRHRRERGRGPRCLWGAGARGVTSCNGSELATAAAENCRNAVSPMNRSTHN